MLLSMYASYHWARLSKKTYVPNMTVFILLISFFSASFPLGMYILLTFPVTFLSFPFYADNLHIPPWIQHHEISFLTVDIIHSTESSWWGFFSFVSFLFFLLVNILGALLGYWIGKRHRIQYSGGRRWIVLVGIVILGLCFVPFNWDPIGWRVSYVLFGFGVFLLETTILSYLLNKFELGRMFPSVEWAKRWLPTVFLLLSLVLPWVVFIKQDMIHPQSIHLPPWIEYTPYLYDSYHLSFLWNPLIEYDAVIYDDMVRGTLRYLPFHENILNIVSALIITAGLCGFSRKKTIRNLGGVLGITGLISYFILSRFSISYFAKGYRLLVDSNPYFGLVQDWEWWIIWVPKTHIWFLSFGFYFALAGSLMLLSPLIRTLIGRIKKRLSSPEQTNEEPIQ